MRKNKRKLKSRIRASKNKVVPLSKLKDLAWVAYSRYIRQKNANLDGFAECVTCGSVMHWKSLQAGHFIPSRNSNVLFAENNVHPQCVGCNIFKNGAWLDYYKFMMRTYGIETIHRLMDLKYAPTKSSSEFREECQNIISLYKNYKK